MASGKHRADVDGAGQLSFYRLAEGAEEARGVGLVNHDGLAEETGVGSVGGVDVGFAHRVRGCVRDAGCEERGYVEFLPDGQVVEDDDRYFGVEFHGGAFEGWSLCNGKQCEATEKSCDRRNEYASMKWRFEAGSKGFG